MFKWNWDIDESYIIGARASVAGNEAFRYNKHDNFKLKEKLNDEKGFFS